MSDPTTSAGWPSRLKSALGPRGGLVVLVIAQFILTVLQSGSVPNDLMEGAPWLVELSPFITSASDGLIAAQVALIAAFISFGDGRVYVRLIRGVLLVLWLELARMVGTHLLDGGRDATVFGAYLARDLVRFSSLLVLLAGFRLAVGKRLTVSTAALPPKHQFRIWQLLALTTEIGVQFALLRSLVPWNRRSFVPLGENVLSQLQPNGLMAIATTCALTGGSIFIVIYVRRRFRCISALVAWPVIVAVVSAAIIRAWPQLDEFYSVFGSLPRPIFGTQTLIDVVHGWAVGANLLFSLQFVRWLGYDFLPLPRRGGGRQSSEATSAA